MQPTSLCSCRQQPISRLRPTLSSLSSSLSLVDVMSSVATILLLVASKTRLHYPSWSLPSSTFHLFLSKQNITRFLHFYFPDQLRIHTHPFSWSTSSLVPCLSYLMVATSWFKLTLEWLMLFQKVCTNCAVSQDNDFVSSTSSGCCCVASSWRASDATVAA